MKFRVLLLNQIFKSRDSASSVTEKTLLEFCKRYLQVQNKGYNIARKAELGKFHTIIHINKKILNYLSYLKGKDEDSAVKQAVQFSIDLQISLVICVSRVGEHISLARDMCSHLKRACFGIILMAYRKRNVTFEARFLWLMAYRTRNITFEACLFCFVTYRMRNITFEVRIFSFMAYRTRNITLEARLIWHITYRTRNATFEVHLF